MKKLLFFSIVAITTSGLLGFAWGNSQNSNRNSLSSTIKALRTSQNGLINPLVEYEISSSVYTKELRLFREKVQEEIESQQKNGNITQMASYFRSLNDGPWFGVNEDVSFFPASLLKVPIMISFFKQAETNPDILKKEIPYDESYKQKFGDANEGSFFKPEKSIEFGKTYTIQELIKYMIIYSDKNAKNLLLLNLGDVNNLLSVYTDLGLGTQPELQGEGDIISVHEYSTFLRVLYNASYLSKDYSKQALELLVEAKFPLGLSAEIPKDVKIANKFGEYTNPNNNTKQLHDCGIIYYPKNPYILCIMTRGNDFGKMADAIASISKIVYQEVNNQFR